MEYRSVEDLAHVWREYAEMEIRHENAAGARTLLGRATAPPGRKYVDYRDQNESIHKRVHKSLSLWSLYADLEENLGTVETTKSVYDRILDLKIATPQTIMNYAAFLEEHKYFEEAFRVYERGIELFKYPVAFEIWNTYLAKFVKRYGGEKLERVRDLFEQALDGVPPQYARPLYLMYAKYEEDHGLARNVTKIFDKATSAVAPEDRLEMFQLFIQKASQLFGVTSTREIYESAISVLPDRLAKDMSLKYADLERKLGEIDRARAIYAHASQFCDPRADPSFWQLWHEFEVRHGNEDTFREMLRIKRSVQAKYGIQGHFAVVPSDATPTEDGAKNDIEALEKQQTQLDLAPKPLPGIGIAFAKAKSEAVSGQKRAANPDEIEIDQDMNSGDGKYLSCFGMLFSLTNKFRS